MSVHEVEEREWTATTYECGPWIVTVTRYAEGAIRTCTLEHQDFGKLEGNETLGGLHMLLAAVQNAVGGEMERDRERTS